MRTALASFLLLTASGGLAAADDEAVAKELKALAGLWRIVPKDVDGKPVPKNQLAAPFNIYADGKADVRSPDGVLRFQVQHVVDPAKKPKTIDIEYLGGPLEGQKFYGIYKTDGDRLILCLAPSGAKTEDRPRDFDAKAAKGALVVWERVLADDVTLESAPPVVVKTIPEAGAAEVDPKLTEIKVIFSKDMKDGTWSWAKLSNESFPAMDGKPKYLKDKRTCVLPVKLEPEKTYAIWVNTEKLNNFKDAGGRSAVPYLLVFKTKK